MPETRAPLLPPQSMQQIAEFVALHHGEQIGVGDIADAVGYSRHHLSRAFKATSGITPSAYLTAVRVESAKHLLLAETCPVMDIAVEVGFDSLSSFTRRFSLTVGTTPGRLRELARRLEVGSTRPFSVAARDQPRISVRSVLPDGVQDDCHLWLGWYPSPAPVGLPSAGMLHEYEEVVSLAVQPGAPWLLGFVVERRDDHLHQLAPQWPVVARHPRPLGPNRSVVLNFRRAVMHDIPLLSALPVLAN